MAAAASLSGRTPSAPRAAPPRTPIDVAVLRLPEGAADWDLVAAYLRLRKEVFIDRMAWALNHYEGAEYEQYDMPHTVYVVAHREREVLGGARLNPTTAVNGAGAYAYSYMIRDACRGLLPGMPRDLCSTVPPMADDVWELTRLATLRDPAISEAILRASNAFLSGIAVRQCLFLGSPAFMRVARRLGGRAEPLGPVSGNHDGRLLAFACDVLEQGFGDDAAPEARRASSAA